MNTIAFHLARHSAEKKNRDLSRAKRWFLGDGPHHYADGYFFKSERDWREVARAKGCEQIRHVHAPITIVSGCRPGCGKTALMREIITAAHGDKNPGDWFSNDMNDDQLRKALSCALADGDGYLWIDDVSARTLRNQCLAFFATAREVPVRRLGERVASIMPNNLRIYLSGNLAGAIPETLIRCSRIINLA